MKYEFRAPSLQQAVAKSLQNNRIPPNVKSSATIYAGEGGRYNWETVYISVERGFHYAISWTAYKPASDGSSYGIDIQSNDGNGSHREAFRDSGSWSFTARTTAEVSFRIGVSYSSASIFGNFPIEIDID